LAGFAQLFLLQFQIGIPRCFLRASVSGEARIIMTPTSLLAVHADR
jgi:hypothetical protein